MDWIGKINYYEKFYFKGKMWVLYTFFINEFRNRIYFYFWCCLEFNVVKEGVLEVVNLLGWWMVDILLIWVFWVRILGVS